MVEYIDTVKLTKRNRLSIGALRGSKIISSKLSPDRARESSLYEEQSGRGREHRIEAAPTLGLIHTRKGEKKKKVTMTTTVLKAKKYQLPDSEREAMLLRSSA